MCRLALLTAVFSGLLLSHFAFGEEQPEKGIAEKYEVVAVENVAYRPNEIFLHQEDLRAPRFKDLRSRYRLDEVVRVKRTGVVDCAET